MAQIPVPFEDSIEIPAVFLYDRGKPILKGKFVMTTVTNFDEQFLSILGIKNTFIDDIQLVSNEIVAYGEPFTQKSFKVHVHPDEDSQCRCPICGQKCVKNGYRQLEESCWRASNLNGVPVYLYYRPQRILCPEHGALNEAVPWQDGKTRFTPAFNDEVAWLVGQVPKTAISVYEDIHWRTVGCNSLRIRTDFAQ